MGSSGAVRRGSGQGGNSPTGPSSVPPLPPLCPCSTLSPKSCSFSTLAAPLHAPAPSSSPQVGDFPGAGWQQGSPTCTHQGGGSRVSLQPAPLCLALPAHCASLFPWQQEPERPQAGLFCCLLLWRSQPGEGGVSGQGGAGCWAAPAPTTGSAGGGALHQIQAYDG